MDAHVKIWDIEKNELIKDMDRGITECWSGAISNDGNFVAVGTESGAVKYININTESVISLQDSNIKDFVMCVAVVCFIIIIITIIHF